MPRLVCEHCGYDLAGLALGAGRVICPECGRLAQGGFPAMGPWAWLKGLVVVVVVQAVVCGVCLLLAYVPRLWFTSIEWEWAVWIPGWTAFLIPAATLIALICRHQHARNRKRHAAAIFVAGLIACGAMAIPTWFMIVVRTMNG